jgi:hypothetical protein
MKDASFTSAQAVNSGYFSTIASNSSEVKRLAQERNLILNQMNGKLSTISTNTANIKVTVNTSQSEPVKR